MRYRKRRTFRSEKRTKMLLLFFILLIFLTSSIVLIDLKARPIIKTIAVNKAKNTASSIASDAVDSYICKENITYSDLSSFIYDDQNNISAVNINIETANLLESQVSGLIGDKLNSTKKTKIEIPIGSIIGGNFLSGRGPKIKIYMALESRCTSNVTSDFTAVGINQTRHTVYLSIKNEIHIIMNGNATSTYVTNKIIIAETILLGNVPYVYSS